MNQPENNPPKHTFCRIHLAAWRADAKQYKVDVRGLGAIKLRRPKGSSQRYHVYDKHGGSSSVAACCAWEAKAIYIGGLVKEKAGDD